MGYSVSSDIGSTNSGVIPVIGKRFTRDSHTDRNIRTHLSDQDRDIVAHLNDQDRDILAHPSDKDSDILVIVRNMINRINLKIYHICGLLGLVEWLGLGHSKNFEKVTQQLTFLQIDFEFIEIPPQCMTAIKTRLQRC